MYIRDMTALSVIVTTILVCMSHELQAYGYCVNEVTFKRYSTGFYQHCAACDKFVYIYEKSMYVLPCPRYFSWNDKIQRCSYKSPTCFPDECSAGTHTCHYSARCVWGRTDIPYRCLCGEGFINTGYRTCIDIDECARPGICATNGVCKNIPGSYTCTCKYGFRGHGLVSCYDIDECATINPCFFSESCVNTPGSYQCTCLHGYTGDGWSCTPPTTTESFLNLIH